MAGSIDAAAAPGAGDTQMTAGGSVGHADAVGSTDGHTGPAGSDGHAVLETGVG